MKRLPSLKQLRFFASLDRHLHFGKAAKACFVAQPTFSVAIKELEGILGVKLAERTNKQVVITYIGKKVAERVRKIIVDVEELAEVAHIQRTPLTGGLRLGVIPTIAPFALPKLLPKILRRYPNLNLQIKEGITRNIYQDMVDDKLDLLLIALPFKLENVETMSLFRDYFFFASREGTQLLKSSYTSDEDLPDKSILLLEDGHCLRDHTLLACNIQHTSKISPYTTSSLHTLVQMVDNDLGVTFIPQLAIQSKLLKKTNIKLFQTSNAAYREIGFAWRKGAVHENEFRLFAEFFKELDPNKK